MGVRFKDLTLHYQPQVTADGTRIVAVEALLRVLKPTERFMRPSDVLERYAAPDEAEALDFWIASRAFTDALRWPALTMSINLTVERFRDPTFPDRLAALAATIGIDPRRIELEIVEGSYIADFDAALLTIGRLRALGFRIAIDDFGTGYSSLTYLLKLPVDKLKIDKSFIDDVTTLRSAAIVQATLAMARAIGIKVTAEGVETPEQWRFLKAAGCHYLQGWLFSKAVDADALTRLLDGAGTFAPVTAAS